MSDDMDFDLDAGTAELALAGVKKLNQNMRKLHERLKEVERNEQLMQQLKAEVDEMQSTMVKIETLLDVSSKSTTVNVDAGTRIDGDVTGDVAGGDMTK